MVAAIRWLGSEQVQRSPTLFPTPVAEGRTLFLLPGAASLSKQRRSFGTYEAMRSRLQSGRDRIALSRSLRGRVPMPYRRRGSFTSSRGYSNGAK